MIVQYQLHEVLATRNYILEANVNVLCILLFQNAIVKCHHQVYFVEWYIASLFTISNHKGIHKSGVCQLF